MSKEESGSSALKRIYNRDGPSFLTRLVRRLGSSAKKGGSTVKNTSVGAYRNHIKGRNPEFTLKAGVGEKTSFKMELDTRQKKDE